MGQGAECMDESVYFFSIYILSSTKTFEGD